MGVCSRREADRLLSGGRISRDGHVLQLGDSVEPGDILRIDGKEIRKEMPRPVLLRYYKPRGVICTSSEKDRGQTLREAVDYPERLFPIGRLDKESEGLLLLTNQGELVNLVNRARNYHEKEYIVTVNRPLTKDFLRRMADGVELPELDTTTRPCEVFPERGQRLTESRSFHIILTQGLNRQIRRMCRALGYEVERLKRIRVMKVTVEGLKEGEWEEISREELGLG